MYELWVNMGDGRPWLQLFYEMRDTKKMAEKIKAVLQDGGTIQLRGVLSNGEQDKHPQPPVFGRACGAD